MRLLDIETVTEVDTDRQHARPAAGLADGDAHGDVALAWPCYQQPPTNGGGGATHGTTTTDSGRTKSDLQRQAEVLAELGSGLQDLTSAG